MAIQRAVCVHHADRPAIGVCIVTKKHICAECSTRIDGVNYSKEGLAILSENRVAGAARGQWTERMLRLSLYSVFLVGLGFLFVLFQSTMTLVVDLEQWRW